MLVMDLLDASYDEMGISCMEGTDDLDIPPPEMLLGIREFGVYSEDLPKYIRRCLGRPKHFWRKPDDEYIEDALVLLESRWCGPKTHQYRFVVCCDEQDTEAQPNHVYIWLALEPHPDWEGIQDDLLSRPTIPSTLIPNIQAHIDARPEMIEFFWLG